MHKIKQTIGSTDATRKVISCSWKRQLTMRAESGSGSTSNTIMKRFDKARHQAVDSGRAAQHLAGPSTGSGLGRWFNQPVVVCSAQRRPQSGWSRRRRRWSALPNRENCVICHSPWLPTPRLLYWYAILSGRRCQRCALHPPRNLRSEMELNTCLDFFLFFVPYSTLFLFFSSVGALRLAGKGSVRVTTRSTVFHWRRWAPI